MKLSAKGLLVVTVMASTICPLARASDFPDWIVQAAAVKTPPCPPDTTAVILLEDKLLTIQSDGKVIERYREVTRILRPQGREYSGAGVDFNKDQKLHSFHAWSIGADGHQYTVKDNEVVERGSGDWGMLYDDIRVKSARPPGADPGAIIAFEYEKQLPPYFTENTWGLQNPIPTVKSVFEADLPSGWKHLALWGHYTAVVPVEVAPNHWRWQLDNIPGVDLEDVSLAPAWRSLAGHMVIHFAPTDVPTGDALWAQIGNWYDGLASPRTEAPGDIAAKSRELAGTDADFMDRIQRVAQFLQRDIRYVGIEIGIGGFQPHAAADIFKNRYGDCKDKATLLISMLNAVGVRATWVLVDTHRGVVDPAVPSVAGNHAIAAIEIPVGYNDPRLRAVVTAKTGKRYLIFDPTNESVSIGLLPTYEQGGYGTLVAGKDSQVIQLPLLKPDADLSTRSATFDLAADGTLKGKVTEMRFGASSDRIRRLYFQNGEKEQRENLERNLRLDLPAFTLGAESAQNAHDLDKQMLLTFEVSAPSYARKAGALVLLRPRILGRDSHELIDKPRVYPIDLGRTGTWRDSFDVNLPAGFTVDELPDPVDLDVGFATYHSEVKADTTVVHYKREYIVKQLTLKPEQYDDLKRLDGVITADENRSAVLKQK
jgi:Domain of Unknown Function with PDB structure (DUF3857)/Transglutaminase-like superfamily